MNKRQGFAAIVAAVLLIPALTHSTLSQAGDVRATSRPAVNSSSGADLDHDGILDFFEDQLIQQFAPVVKLDNDCCRPDPLFKRPSSVDWFLNQGTSLGFHDCTNPYACFDYFHITAGNIKNGKNLLGKIDFEFGIEHSSGLSESVTNFFISVPGEAKPGNLETATAYAHVVRVPGVDTYEVTYWFFYPDNGPLYLGTTGYGEHEGDWENITLIVRLDYEDHWVIDKINYVEHGIPHWYIEFPQYSICPDHHHPEDCIPYTLEAGRPIVYSAWHSHASYPWGGEHKRHMHLPYPPFYIDLPSDWGCEERPEVDNCLIWDTLTTGGGVQNIGEKDYPMPGMEWIQYSGRWGAYYLSDGRSPHGPAYGAAWTDPGYIEIETNFLPLILR